MCSRYAYFFLWEDIWIFSEPFRGVSEDLRLNFRAAPKTYNAAPKTNVPVLYMDAEGPLVGAMRWWLVPAWSKEPDVKFATFNARSEDAASKPTFRGPLRYRRCVIPASGFYEWKKLDAKTKRPYFITRADESPLFFAGLWDLWNEELASCTILTTTPNAEMEPLHNRMPCILERDELTRWLDPEVTQPADVQPLLRPAADGTLKMHPVSPRIGNVRNNDADLIEPFSGHLFE